MFGKIAPLRRLYAGNALIYPLETRPRRGFSNIFEKHLLHCDEN